MAATQGIKLDEETRERLKALGKVRDRSPHWLMRTAILTYLEREEQYEREKREDLERWEQYKLTGHSVSNEPAVAWLTKLSEGKVEPCPE